MSNAGAQSLSTDDDIQEAASIIAGEIVGESQEVAREQSEAEMRESAEKLVDETVGGGCGNAW